MLQESCFSGDYIYEFAFQAITYMPLFFGAGDGHFRVPRYSRALAFAIALPARTKAMVPTFSREGQGDKSMILLRCAPQ